MMRDFWWGLGQKGVLSFGMAVIGFSLSKQDEYARQVIYGLVKNYQTTYWEKNPFDHKKSPLVLVDLKKSPTEKQEFRHRYAFVDWNRAETHFDGFDKEAIELLSRG